MKRKQRAVLIGVLALVVVVAVIVISRRTSPPPQPPEVAPAPEEPAAAEAAPQVEEEKPEAPAQDVQEVVEEDALDAAVEKATPKLQPVVWKKPRFDHMPDKFSPEDRQKAELILSRYFDNFSEISSLSVHHEQRLTALADTKRTRMLLTGWKNSNFSYSVEAVRTPLYFKIKGEMGGKELEEIITPAGKISDGRLGRGASWIPKYLDGKTGGSIPDRDFTFKLAGQVEIDVEMDENPPGLEEYTKKARENGVRYDVIVVERKDPGAGGYDVLTKYWFNRDTGMMDFATHLKITDKPTEQPWDAASAHEYCNAGGVYYPKHFVDIGMYLPMRWEEHFTDIVINGVAAKAAEQ